MTRRLHTRVEPSELNPDTREALLELKRCLDREGWFKHAQITFDHVHSPEHPPTIDVLGRMVKDD